MMARSFVKGLSGDTLLWLIFRFSRTVLLPALVVSAIFYLVLVSTIDMPVRGRVAGPGGVMLDIINPMYDPEELSRFFLATRLPPTLCAVSLILFVTFHRVLSARNILRQKGYHLRRFQYAILASVSLRTLARLPSRDEIEILPEVESRNMHWYLLLFARHGER